MATFELTQDNHHQTLENNEIVIIDFWAPWCGPCQAFGPTFEKVSEKYSDVAFAKCNTQDEQELAGAFRIRSIPTVMVFKQGSLVFNQSGMLPEAALTELVEKIQELDMEAVKKQAG
ncbi:MAG: thioredoxin [Gammaproteobacteria bacterium]|nr:MAG: thioredoxin [Gammaproteobacteria bacterium]